MRYDKQKRRMKNDESKELNTVQNRYRVLQRCVCLGLCMKVYSVEVCNFNFVTYLLGSIHTTTWDTLWRIAPSPFLSHSHSHSLTHTHRDPYTITPSHCTHLPQCCSYTKQCAAIFVAIIVFCLCVNICICTCIQNFVIYTGIIRRNAFVLCVFCQKKRNENSVSSVVQSIVSLIILCCSLYRESWTSRIFVHRLSYIVYFTLYRIQHPRTLFNQRLKFFAIAQATRDGWRMWRAYYRSFRSFSWVTFPEKKK